MKLVESSCKKQVAELKSHLHGLFYIFLHRTILEQYLEWFNFRFSLMYIYVMYICYIFMITTISIQKAWESYHGFLNFLHFYAFSCTRWLFRDTDWSGRRRQSGVMIGNMCIIWISWWRWRWNTRRSLTLLQRFVFVEDE